MDWGFTFSELHEQFNWPYPAVIKSPALTRRDSKNSVDKGWGVGRRPSQLGIITKRTSTLNLRESELRNLMNTAKDGDFPELALLVSTMLQDIDNCLAILQHHPQFKSRWENALLSIKESSYPFYAQALKEILSK